MRKIHLDCEIMMQIGETQLYSEYLFEILSFNSLGQETSYCKTCSYTAAAVPSLSQDALVTILGDDYHFRITDQD